MSALKEKTRDDATIPAQMANALDLRLDAYAQQGSGAHDGYRDGWRYWLQGLDAAHAPIDRRQFYGKHFVLGYRAAIVCYDKLRNARVSL